MTRYKIFTDPNDFVKAYKNVDYVMVDLNWLILSIEGSF